MLPDRGVDKAAFQKGRFTNPFVGKLLASKKIDRVGIEGFGNHEDLGPSPEDVRIRIVVAGVVKTKHWWPQFALC